MPEAGGAAGPGSGAPPPAAGADPPVRPRTRAGLARILWALLVAAVPAHTSALVAVGGVDVPYQDAWELTPVVERALDGEVRPGDLWAQTNEHRPVLPRLVMLALARASGWNVRLEMAASLACALGSLVLLVRSVGAAGRAAGRPTAWATPALAAVLLSFAQWQNWLWGWQLTLLLAQAATVLALLLAARGGRGALAGAAAAAAAASFCVASGLGAWPAGLVVLALAEPAGPGRRRRLAAWGLAAAAVGGAYAVGYVRPGVVQLAGPGDLGLVAVYLLAFLGAPLIMGLGIGAAWGAVLGLAGLVVVADGARRARAEERPEVRRALAAWVGLAAWAACAGAMCAVGRAAHGVEQVLTASRYLAFSSVFWAAVVALLALREAPRGWPARSPWAGVALVGLLAAGCSAAHHGLAARWRRTYYNAAVRAAAGRPEALQVLHYYRTPEETARRMEVLRRRRLSLFRDGGPR